MNIKYKVVFTVTFLLISFSIGSSILNYMKALEETQTQLKERSLPLSIDNIYTEVQKNLIEPTLVSSMMANDTFLKDWLLLEETDVDKITKYLETIKNKYNMFTTFLVSEKTGNYYTYTGLLEKIEKENSNNSWYYKFKAIQEPYEINLDFNKFMGDSLIMFVNYKIFDEKYHYLGATGIGIKISYINDMLKHFRVKYKFKVYFVDKNGNVVLSENNNTLKSLNDIEGLKAYKDDILVENSNVIEYMEKNRHYVLNTKYIKELNLHLIVEAKVENFTAEVEKTFYLNLIISLGVTSLIIFIILVTIKEYNRKLERLAAFDSLTKLPNRRNFNQYFEKALRLFARDNTPRSVVFFDIDNFKLINDNYGHLVGDRVLKRIATILNMQIRSSDMVSRWGGEEFLVLLNDSQLEDSVEIAQKIRISFENDIELNDLIKGGVTASFGVTTFKEGDTIEKIVARADKALYEAKRSGKNIVIQG
ncbi:sensor domain-containing diguanylate cyclase [Candidatus Marinarcus aquaticus]|uniref:diguanylate cyclase n=1 Tax=Candidatus Marinarcus aquaticus TaxID=2044504 RepID=A0A4Q0XNN2_9BACT|nr:sensor domain-containing diguanylate cyclase [Candidatus Marinarcus aquaticus]RXJ54591.1 GGDEF domain-containing protein [Candidatus Marinarcus aquaticus]